MPLNQVPMIATHNSYNTEEDGVSTKWEVCICGACTAAVFTIAEVDATKSHVFLHQEGESQLSLELSPHPKPDQLREELEPKQQVRNLQGNPWYIAFSLPTYLSLLGKKHTSQKDDCHMMQTRSAALTQFSFLWFIAQTFDNNI